MRTLIVLLLCLTACAKDDNYTQNAVQSSPKLCHGSRLNLDGTLEVHLCGH